MKLYALSLSLGLALLAMTQGPASAADWNYGDGSIKDVGYGAQAIAVPAPVPVPIYRAEYYFRADAGLGFGASPTASQKGLVYGYDRNGGPFGVDSAWLDNDFESFVTLGVGVGRYWGDSLRTDFTAETRSQGKVKINGDYDYVSTNNNGVTRRVRGHTYDETTLRGGIFLANAYYDFNHLSRNALRPYIGAGLGFAWNELKRNHTTTESDCIQAPVNIATCSNYVQRDYTNVQDKTHSISLAAAATVGLTYKISDNASLDMNYRFLYIDGMNVGLGIYGNQFGGNTQVSIGETYEHQLRAGVRYDIN